jgi:hypothetical protein
MENARINVIWFYYWFVKGGGTRQQQKEEGGYNTAGFCWAQ